MFRFLKIGASLGITLILRFSFVSSLLLLISTSIFFKQFYGLPKLYYSFNIVVVVAIIQIPIGRKV